MAEESTEVPRELTGKSCARGFPPSSALLASAALSTRAGVFRSSRVSRPRLACDWEGYRRRPKVCSSLPESQVWRGRRPGLASRRD